MRILYSLIKKLIKSGAKTPEDLAVIKRKTAKERKIPCFNNIQLLKAYHRLVLSERIKKSQIIENLLRTRPIRSLSGIVNVSVLTKPYPCPGKCLYCPTEKNIPKSYVSGEPAVERAKRLKYSPYLQVKKRIEMLESEGHPTDKIELRIVGGTWSYYPKQYRAWFIKRCLDACNNKNSKLKSQNAKLQFKIKNLRNVQRINETAKHRVVGLSIETRPDFIDEKEVKSLRELGVTMVELGVQSVYDDVLILNRRGHGVKAIIESTKLLKDAGFKVLYQIMPNLPGSSLARDLKMFKELFTDHDFQPDLLKIYPCALLKKAPLYKRWKQKKYKPYADNELINLIKAIKETIPHYVRIQRIIRDIPGNSIVAGPAKISNLRQLIAGQVKCKCIRCREVRADYAPKEKTYLFRQDYDASSGKEIFLSFENKNKTKLYSLLRLRIASDNRAVIRELHTYGQQLLVNDYGNKRSAGQKTINSPQHKGFGKKLIGEAEKIACTELSRSAKKKLGRPEIAAISGVGVRGYYRALGYKLKNTYMVKNLKIKKPIIENKAIGGRAGIGRRTF